MPFYKGLIGSMALTLALAAIFIVAGRLLG
jgi:hypothetical protein